MMLADNELDLVASGDDVSRGLVAVNLVQDWFELMAAQESGVCQSTDSVSIGSGFEYTSFPADLLRMDGDPELLDATTLLPIGELTYIDKVGGHRRAPFAANSGCPAEYWTEGPGGRFYWSPQPDANYEVRIYGLWAKADYTIASDTFLYPDSVAVLVSQFGPLILRTGLDRDLSGVQSLVKQAAKDVIEALKGFRRVDAPSRVYTEIHEA
jgi:hypothetical protein